MNFTCWRRTQTKNKQEPKPTAVKVWLSIAREETQRLVLELVDQILPFWLMFHIEYLVQYTAADSRKNNIFVNVQIVYSPILWIPLVCFLRHSLVFLYLVFCSFTKPQSLSTSAFVGAVQLCSNNVQTPAEGQEWNSAAYYCSISNRLQESQKSIISLKSMLARDRMFKALTVERHDNEDYPYHDTAWLLLLIWKIACAVSMKQVNNTFDSVILWKLHTQIEILLIQTVMKLNNTGEYFFLNIKH